MLNLYCGNCGAKNAYTIKKPEKCVICDCSLNVIQSSVDTKSIKRIPVQEEIETARDYSLPEITKFEIEFIGTKVSDLKKRDNTLGSILGTMQGETPHVRVRNKKYSQKKVLAEFMKEASSSRESIGIGD